MFGVLFESLVLGFKKWFMLNLSPFPFTVGLLQALSHCYYNFGEKAVHLFSVLFRREQDDFG